MTENSTELPEFFDPSQYEGTTFDLLPIGVYPAQIIEAAVTQPQSGDGYGIEATWQITGGDYEGRRVWQRIIFQHSSNQAQDIGRREFKDLCDACGITKGFNSVEPLKFIPCKIRIGVKKDKDGIYDDKNKVTRVWPFSYEPPASRRSPNPPKSPTVPRAAAARPSAPASSPAASSPAASSPAASSPAPAAVEATATMMQGVRFANYQPPNPTPQTPASSPITGEVKAMIIALHTKSRLVPQEIARELAKIDIKIPTSTVESLLVEWNKYDIGVVAGANGGTPPPNSPSQPSSQAPSQPVHGDMSYGDTAHGKMPPWRG
jgi:hypothetical protein